MVQVGEPPAVNASSWTGRVTPREQAMLVHELAPAALLAVECLIDDELRRRDNGGPVDADRDEALAHLRALHAALGELIRLAATDEPLGVMMGKLQSIGQSARITVGKAAAAMPVTASALVAFASVVGIADFFVGNVVVSLAAGGIAGNTVKDVMLKKEAKTPD
jgi:hypothetical protein